SFSGVRIRPDESARGDPREPSCRPPLTRVAGSAGGWLVPDPSGCDRAPPADGGEDGHTRLRPGDTGLRPEPRWLAGGPRHRRAHRHALGPRLGTAVAPHLDPGAPA